MIPAELLDDLLGGLADRIADRVAAILEERLAVDVSEPWKLIDLADVCRRLGRSERQVRQWAKSGELRYVRLDGGRFMFDIEDVRAFAQSRTVGVGVEVLDDRWQYRREPASGKASQPPHRAIDRRVADA